MTLASAPMWIPGLAALALAVLFVFVRPRVPADGGRAWLLRWGHPLAWALLSGACFTSEVSSEAGFYVALAGLTAFLGFFGAWSTAPEINKMP